MLIKRTLPPHTNDQKAPIVRASTGIELPHRKTLWIWVFILTIISLVYLSTIGFAPYLHADELMTVELGRIILHPDTDWSIVWLTEKNQPVVALSYAGPVLQELSYDLLGQFGPRISSLFGALFAATVLRQWLMARGTAPKASFLLALIFLLDPIFVQSYTIGRVDGWAMGLCITSCWLLRNVTSDLPSSLLLKRRLLLPGALTILAVFIWPSAVFLFPLIFYELLGMVNKHRSLLIPRQKIIYSVSLFAGGGLICGVMLILAIVPNLYSQADNILYGIKANIHSGPQNSSLNISSVVSSLAEFLSILKFTPLLSLCAVWGLFWRRDMILLALMLTAVILMVCTSVYIERVQYLLPYLVAFAAGIYQQNNGRAKMEPGPVKTVLLVSMMLWAVILSVFTRTVLAFNGKENRNRNIVYDAAASLIGNGNYKVFAPYEFYYAGRSLGWKMYGAYIPRKDSFSVSILQNLLPRVDYVIDRSASQLSPEFKAELEKEDLREEKTYDSYKEPLEKFDGKTTNIVRLQNLYSIFPRPYGPYKMYERGAGYTGLNEGQ